MDIRLPRGYRGRAENIGRLTARALASMSLPPGARIERMDLPAVRVNRGETDGVIARRIAGAIGAQLRGGGGSEGCS